MKKLILALALFCLSLPAMAGRTIITATDDPGADYKVTVTTVCKAGYVFVVASNLHGVAIIEAKDFRDSPIQCKD